MVFSSISFLYYFLPLVLFFYFIVPNKFKNYILLLFSLIFYFYGEPKYIILMILEILICYYGSKLIKNNKYNLYILIFIHLLILFVFKYTNFIIFNINSLFNINFNFINIVLPIGISFYTFQIISYEIDVYRKDVEVQNNFFVLAMYISLFPQLVAGPIVRYSDICNDLYNRKCNFSDISYGIKRFIIGLSKKVLLANTLGEFCSVFNSYNDKTLIFYWMYGICFMLQIYFDFSGYSDMAIGLGKVFGFKFLENFNYPYLSQSITEFFRRWHISLGKWFKDYLYIPLGGNRYKLSRNILIVWILTGLWHGASWNFIVWGLYCGIFILIEKKFLKKYIEKLPKMIQILYTLFIIMISFIIFSGENMGDSFNNIVGLFNINNKIIDSFTLYNLRKYIVIILIGIISSTPIIKYIYKKYRNNFIFNFIEIFIIFGLLMVCTAYLIDSSYNPFLYFRF